VVDTTAAGDAFTAALTLEYLRNGKDIKAAVTYANTAAAIAITRKGASSSVPTEEEVNALYKK
jgi:ribokinase